MCLIYIKHCLSIFVLVFVVVLFTYWNPVFFKNSTAYWNKLETVIHVQGEYFISEALHGHFTTWLKKKMGFMVSPRTMCLATMVSLRKLINSFLLLITMPLMNTLFDIVTLDFLTNPTNTLSSLSCPWSFQGRPLLWIGVLSSAFLMMSSVALIPWIDVFVGGELLNSYWKSLSNCPAWQLDSFWCWVARTWHLVIFTHEEFLDLFLLPIIWSLNFANSRIGSLQLMWTYGDLWDKLWLW